MRIAVLGTGNVGRTLAGRLADLDHSVTLGTRDVAVTRARADVANWLDAHPAVTLVPFAEAAESAELAVHASNGEAALEVLAATGEHLDDKVLLDVSNPLDFSRGFPPTLFVKDDDSLAEQIQAAHPRARVVKSLNTMNADLMVHPETLADGDHSVFVSGDDAEAKATVTALLQQIGHRDVIDLGPLETARGTEMYLPLWLRLYGALGTFAFNVKLVR